LNDGELSVFNLSFFKNGSLTNPVEQKKTGREGGEKIKNFQFFIFSPPSLSGF
jgi:hypothetical protein